MNGVQNKSGTKDGKPGTQYLRLLSRLLPNFFPSVSLSVHSPPMWALPEEDTLINPEIDLSIFFINPDILNLHHADSHDLYTEFIFTLGMSLVFFLFW